MKTEKIILNCNDVLEMLDEVLEEREHEWWNTFYKDRDKKVPFFIDFPDDNLVQLIKTIDRKPLSALDIGCGNGRNSFYLESKNISVKGIDFSEESISWAHEKNNKIINSKASFEAISFFDFEPSISKYDFIYDSGCLHHIKPHRRADYLSKVSSLLSTDGIFALNCFTLKGGANLSDYDVYRNNSMSGGLGYSKEKLMRVLEEHFDIISFDEMQINDNDQTMSLDILWNVVMK